ncbi:MAG: 1,2-phenylacetyl-CoA epoxidase subunit PaaC [Pseudomonadota bacterium]
MQQTQHTDPEALLARRLGDDALVMGQRLCEWCANAPTLEEELALANVALDYLGRARFCYAHAGAALDRTEDELAFLRDAAEFENLLMVELPRGDFAFTMVRQYLLDVFELLYFAGLSQSGSKGLAAIAAKTHKEVQYHLRRSRQWLRQLALGTTVSRDRTEAALDELWGYVEELFAMDALESALVDAGIGVDRQALRADWMLEVEGLLSQLELVKPAADWQVHGGRQGVHTEHLGHLLAQMQFMQRAYPGLQW